MSGLTGSAVAIGECMVELSRGSDGRFSLAYGGDTFNTSVYLARCGVSVRYATALGDDPYSDAIAALAAREGVVTDLIARVAGRMPGLYLIETSVAGERTFHYWRERSPARELLAGSAADATIAAVSRAPLVYCSGITLSLYSAAALDRLHTAFTACRAAGGLVALDGNYRPRGWAGDRERARHVLERFWRLATHALPTFEDEAMLWDDTSPADTIDRLSGLGVPEIAVKLGADGAIVAGPAGHLRVPVPVPVTAIDTSAAGDSFNAAYLAARLAGLGPPAAATAGHRLAGIVVQHRGAIAPREATAAAVRLMPSGAPPPPGQGG